MNKTEKIALVQKGLTSDWKCAGSCFKEKTNIFMTSEDVFFEIITFGKNVVLRADPQIYDWCVNQFRELTANEIMNGENLFSLELKLREFNQGLAGEHVRYVYMNPGKVLPKPHNFEYKLFDRNNMAELYHNKGFRNALNYRDDVIAFGAFVDDKLVALSGADDRMGVLWQIGVDTLSPYRQKGLAAYLVKTLANEIEKCDALPFYTTFSSNIASTYVALNAGFRPAWVGYYSRLII